MRVSVGETTETKLPERKSRLQSLTELALNKSDEEDTDLELDLDFDPTKPSLQATASAGYPFSVCWSREVRPILSGLDVSRLKDPAGPWVLESPFDASLTRLSTIIADPVRNGSGGLSTAGHYRDGLTTTSESKTEHLSAGLGISVGFPFLSGSVTANYDRSIAEDKNGVKASRNASCRAGRVVLDRTPVFSREAVTTLQAGGEKCFRERYGDYYVCGFVLGADAGACMSASTEAKSSVETLEVTVTIEVLFYEESFTYTEVTEERSEASSISFNGYSTMDEVQPCSLTLSAGTAAPPADQRALKQKAREYLDKVKAMQQKIQGAIKGLGLEDGGKLPLADCTRLCRSGLVVELLLAPFARLNQYVECVR